MALPPGLSQAEFNRALADFQAVVGNDWVFSSDEDIALYRDSYSILWDEPEERLASAAVAPNSVEQVQEIVRIANRYKIPLYPISTGRNLTYGGCAPTYTGSVVVDLKRMNRILEVDEKRHFALVEPGVSYYDLYNYITERGLKVMLDVPDPGWGSPMGNSLDHGGGYTLAQFRDHFRTQCGMEVVTAEGEIMRTGMGAQPEADNWQDFYYGCGPSVDGLFAQSNFGIVTKMGFWLMPMPETYMSGYVSVPRYRDFATLVEECNYLEDLSLIGMPRFDSPHALQANNPESGLFKLLQNGWPSIDELETYLAGQDLPAWRVKLQFYGTEETGRAGWAAAQRRMKEKIPDATFAEGEFYTLPIPPEEVDNLPDKASFGIPSLEIFNIVTRFLWGADDPADGHADQFIMLPRKGESVWEASRMLWEAFRDNGFNPMQNPFTTPLNFWHRCLIIPTLVPTYRDPDRNRKSRTLFADIMDRAGEKGWSPYRTAPAFQDYLRSKFSFNDNALLRFQEKLKDSIDPNGIISPGRYGIWPAHLRNKA